MTFMRKLVKARQLYQKQRVKFLASMIVLDGRSRSRRILTLTLSQTLELLRSVNLLVTGKLTGTEHWALQILRVIIRKIVFKYIFTDFD